MTLVTKYQISAINSYWEKCDEKYLGRTEGRTEVKQYTPLPFRGAGYNNVIKSVSELWQVCGFLRVLRFPPPIKLTATIKLNIVESGIKHHNPNPNNHLPLHITSTLINYLFFWFANHLINLTNWGCYNTCVQEKNWGRFFIGIWLSCILQQLAMNIPSSF
jgi:hypothetical protein